MPPSPTAPFTILFVCTGNICRSALAERLARAYLSEVLGDDADVIRLVSGGTQAVIGSAMHPDSAMVLRGLGADAVGFRAQHLRTALAVEPDLVLAMTRRHRAAVLELAPRALSRTFTLREAADLVQFVGEDTELGGSDLTERARGLVAAMAGVRGRRSPGSGDDVPDPIDRPLEVHQEVGEAIAESLLPILDRLAALAAVRTPS